MNSKRKGSEFERVVARKLSLWWTEGARNDVFWRSASSGALATLHRNTKFLSQLGDIAAVDERGAPLTNSFVIEVKRGYSDDRNLRGLLLRRRCMLSDAISKLADSVGGKHWLLIWKVDRQDALLFSDYLFQVSGSGVHLATIVIGGRIHELYHFDRFCADYACARHLKSVI